MRPGAVVQVERNLDRRPPEHVTSLERGLLVLRLLGDGRPRHLKEIAETVPVSPATARRILQTLSRLGYVAQHGSSFTVRVGAMALGGAYLEGLHVRRLAHPHLGALAEEVGESASLAVLDDADVVYVAAALPPRALAASIVVGDRRAALRTAAGRIILAGRGQLGLERGLSLIMPDSEPGLRSVAVPVVGPDGSVIAALSLHGSSSSVHQANRDLLLRLKATAAAIGEAAGPRLQ